MKKLKSLLLPVILLLMLCIQLYAYFNGTINYGNFIIVFALSPAAIKGLYPHLNDNQYFKYFSWFMLTLAVVGVIMFGYYTFF